MPVTRGSHFTSFRATPGRSESKSHPVLGVGSRALVRSRTGRPDGVTLTDDTGMSVVATVADGVEVEILAWRPRGGDTRYRVVAPSAGVEGWLGVASLQRRDPVPPPKPAPPAVRPAARPVPVTRAAAAARTTKFAKKTTR